MKKLWNSILGAVLIMASMMVCFTHLSNTIFQDELGAIVIQEVDLNGNIDRLFQMIENIVPAEHVEQLENLKDGIKNSEKEQAIVNKAGRQMLMDIVNEGVDKQDIHAVMKDMIYSYSDSFKETMLDLGLDTFIDQALQQLPIQHTYEDAVSSFQETIPESYLKVMKLVGIVSKPLASTISIGIAVVMLVLLIILNHRHAAWTFTIGVSGMVSGTLLLITAQIVPRIFESMVMRLGHVMGLLNNIDFHILTRYGVIYLLSGILCMILYFVYTKKRA